MPDADIIYHTRTRKPKMADEGFYSDESSRGQVSLWTIRGLGL